MYCIYMYHLPTIIISTSATTNIFYVHIWCTSGPVSMKFRLEEWHAALLGELSKLNLAVVENYCLNWNLC